MKRILAIVASTLVGAFSFAADVTVTLSGTAAAESVIYLVPRNTDTASKVLDATVDQQDKEFIPLVSIVRTGTPVAFPNSDNIRHHVYSFSPTKVFSLKLYSGRPASPVVFDKPGIVTLGCNIHDHMIAWVRVVDSPWFARADTNGKAVVKNVPAGDYEVRAWHPGSVAEASEALKIESSDLAITMRFDATPIAELRRQNAVQRGAQ